MIALKMTATILVILSALCFTCHIVGRENIRGRWEVGIGLIVVFLLLSLTVSLLFAVW